MMLLWMAACGSSPTGAPPPSAETAAIEPQRVVLHRLNRSEYNHTVRDLLGTALTPADTFPDDDRAAGFDNVAAALTTSTLHLEGYLGAAETLSQEALGLAGATAHRVQAESGLVQADGAPLFGDTVELPAQGTLRAPFSLDAAGDYILSVRAWTPQDEATLTLGGEAVHVSEDPTVHRFVQPLPDGDVDVSVLASDGAIRVDWVDVRGPVGPRSPLLPTCEDASTCALPTVLDVAWRAFRRPLTNLEHSRLTQLVDTLEAEGFTPEEVSEAGLMAVLTSPSFLYRHAGELDPDAPDVTPLDDWAVASRLSYFLWSSMPDAALFEAAQQGALSEPDALRAQVTRMLADPKADALVDNFGGQWLYTRGVPDLSKDLERYTDFDDALKASMAEEMHRFINSFVRQPRDLIELLTATEGAIDARLAAHYGVEAPGEGWTTVDLAALERGGVLGHAGLLAVVSHPSHTSPVLRGQFVLRQLLCDEPPPPPPNVEGLEPASDSATVREQLEAHRADPACVGCHETMDELGFALEHFDAVGAWRLTDQGHPVDARGELPNGTTFTGMREMAHVVAHDPRYPACVVRQTFTYAVGRVPLEADQPALDAITTEFESEGRTFEALARAVVASEAFRFTRREP